MVYDLTSKFASKLSLTSMYYSLFESGLIITYFGDTSSVVIEVFNSVILLTKSLRDIV